MSASSFFLESWTSCLSGRDFVRGSGNANDDHKGINGYPARDRALSEFITHC